MGERDPFTGIWTYRAEKSRSTGPKLARWIQWIEATGETLSVREEVVVATGQTAHVSLEARFDGKEYPVNGSSLADAIAYARLNHHNITGTGKKNGVVTLRETISASAGETVLTLTYSILNGDREVMHGAAVFERQG